MKADRILGLGFVGLGQAVALMLRRKHDLAGLPYRIAAACEVRPHALDAFEREFNGKTYDNVEDLCRSPDVDVVYVATGPELHREQVVTACEHGKHVVVEKPMALTLADCEAMIAAADRNGVKLLSGHTHSFDAPIRHMRQIVKSGRLGDLVMVNTWNYNAFNPRPWPTRELRTTHGPILNQGPHQVDIIRQIGGGLIRSVRAMTFGDPRRACEGGYNCLLEFESGVTASMVYDARGYFDTAELFWWVHEGGAPREPDTNFQLIQRFKALQSYGADEAERIMEDRKELGRYGAQNVTADMAGFWGYPASEAVRYQPFFGITLVSCEKGAMRQSRDGIYIYDDDSVTEIRLDQEVRGRAAELMDLYDSVVHGRPMLHDGRWGMATLEVCLAIITSARDRAEIRMMHQVPLED